MTVSSLSCATATFEYSYSPAPAVTLCHGIPHMTSDLQAADASFNNTKSDPNGYFMSVFGLPMVIMVLGIISVVIFQICLFFRCCCTCCTCGPKTFDKNNPKFQEKVVKRRKFLFWLFYAFALLTILADQALFFGNAQLTLGLDNTQAAFSDLADLTNGVIIEGNDMSSSLNAVETNFATTSCSGNASVLSAFGDMADQIDEFVDLVDPLPEMFTDINADLEEYGREKKDQIIFVFYAFILALVVLFMICPLFQFKLILEFCIVLSEVIVIALTVICCLQMVVATVLADYCMEPTENMLSLLPEGDLHSMVQYYTQCVGDNILTDPLDSLLDLLGDMQDDMQYMYDDNSSPCKGESALLAVKTSLGSLAQNVDNIGCLVGCDSIAPVWETAVSQGFCRDFFTGFATIWIQQFLTAGLLFALSCTASVLYEFYGEWWNLSESSIVPLSEEEQHKLNVADNFRHKNIDDDVEAGSGDVQMKEQVKAAQHEEEAALGVEEQYVEEKDDKGDREE